MATKLVFTKMQAAGNDFVIIEGPRSGMSALAKRICQRKKSVGADGLLVIDESEVADFKMRIFNPDGSEAETCGNGLRCAALFAFRLGRVNQDMTIETKAGVVSASVRDNKIKIKMPLPCDFRDNVTLSYKGKKYSLHFVNVGVPHAVLFVNDLEKAPVFELGGFIRRHRTFKPEGANVDFVKPLGAHRIALRTYERGVEDETLSCGSGAVAASIVAAKTRNLNSPVTVRTRGGETLRVWFGEAHKEVFLEGPAQFAFSGNIRGQATFRHRKGDKRTHKEVAKSCLSRSSYGDSLHRYFSNGAGTGIP